jgi:hypothetical protein
MTVGLPLLGIGVAAIALLVGFAAWYLAVSLFANEERREEREAKRMADQPWDSADGRANR